MQFPQKIKIELPYDPAMPLLGYIQGKKKNSIYSMVMALEAVQDGEAAVARESQQCPHSAHQPLLLDKLGR